MDEQRLQNLYEFLERWGALSGDLEEAYRVGGKSAQDFQKEIDKLTKSTKKQQTSYDQLKRVMTELDDSIEELAASTDKTTAAERAAEIAVKRKMKADLAAEAATKAAAESMRMVAKEGLNKAAQGVGQFVKSLQGDANGTQLASELFNAGIDIATTAAKGTGKTIGALGETMMAGSLAAGEFAPAVFLVGGALKIFGEVTGATADTINKLAKFGVEVLAKEVEKTYKAFNQMSASGALFTDGMTGMREAAANAGLTVEQMSNVVKASSSSIAAAGMSVTEGTKMLGRVGKMFDANGGYIRSQMLKLGFGFEETVGLMADVTRQMRLTGKTVTDQSVIRATQQYAENLRLIAAITGEDAKKKMEEAEVAARELIFRQKIAQMGLNMDTVIAGMAPLPKVVKQSLIDMAATNGAIVNESGAIMRGSIKGFDPMMKELFSALKSGNLTTKNAAEIQAKYGETIQGSIKNAQQFGMAARFAGDDMGDLQASLTDMFDSTLKVTKSSVAGAEAGLSQKDAQDELTQSTIEAEKAAQALKIALQTELTPAIGKFKEVSMEMLQVVQDTIKKLGLGSKTSTGTVVNTVTQAETNTQRANTALEAQYKKEGWKDSIDGALFGNSEEIKKLRKQADEAAAQEDKIKEARINYLTGLNQVTKRLQNEADEKQFGVLGALGLKGGASIDPAKLKAEIEEYNKNFATMENKFDPTQSAKRKEYAKALGMTQSSKYAPMIDIEGIPKFADGGTLPSGKIGIVGEEGPELITGPGEITPNETVQYLKDQIAKINQMIKDTGAKYGQFGDSSYAYTGTMGGSDFKLRPGIMGNFNVTQGMSPTSMQGAQGVLEHYLEQISGKDEGTKATPETYKMLADQAVKMADVFSQVEKLSDQNLPTEKLIDILNAFNLKSGMAGVDKSAEGYDAAQGLIKENLKGFENFDKASIETIIEQRRTREEIDNNKSLDSVPIEYAGEEMRERFSSMLSEKFDEMIDIMKQNADHTAKVAHNTN